MMIRGGALFEVGSAQDSFKEPGDDVGTETLLDEYLSKTRAHHEHAERSEIVKRVEEVFEELKLPWRRDSEAESVGWEVDSDLGIVRAGLDDDEEVLTLFRFVHQLEKSAKKEADYLFTLLSINSDAAGAWFAISETEELGNIVYVVSRISAQKLDPEEVALALQGIFQLLSAYEPN